MFYEILWNVIALWIDLSKSSIFWEIKHTHTHNLDLLRELRPHTCTHPKHTIWIQYDYHVHAHAHTHTHTHTHTHKHIIGTACESFPLQTPPCLNMQFLLNGWGGDTNIGNLFLEISIALYELVLHWTLAFHSYSTLSTHLK